MPPVSRPPSFAIHRKAERPVALCSIAQRFWSASAIFRPQLTRRTRMRSVAALIVIALVALPMPILAENHSSAALAAQGVVDKTKDAAGKTKDAIVKGAKVVGDKTEDGVSKTGEVMTDGWITTRVHAQYVDEPLLKDSDIKVETNNHVVTLTGTVLARAGRTRATTVARGTESVRRVVNRLTIGPKR